MKIPISTPSSQSTRGWRLVAFITVFICLIVAGTLITLGFSSKSIGLVTRTTARTSLILFVGMFVGPALYRRSPGRISGWLSSNHAYLSVSLLVSHVIHAISIAVNMMYTGGASLESRGAVVFVAGGIAYGFMIYIAATAFRPAAARLRSNLTGLSLRNAGMYYIWLLFMNSYGSRAVDSLSYLPFVLLLATALILRLTDREDK